MTEPFLRLKRGRGERGRGREERGDGNKATGERKQEL